MKRFWLILLSLVFITVFSTTVFAADVKFSGEYYAAGVYLDKTSLKKDTSNDGPSTAFYFQRLRVRTDFIVSPGLTLITRFDALERVWGGPRSSAATTLAADSSGTISENENIAFDWAYINYKSPIGVFDVGIMNDGSTGTIFGNSYKPSARIKYAYVTGPFKIALAYTKVKEKNLTATSPTVTYTDADNDKYGILGEYMWKDGKAGINVNYYRYAENRPSANNKKVYTLFTPYAIAKIGPVALQAELNYAVGKYQDYEDTTTDVKIREWTGWIDATATFGPVYFGGTFAYVSGDDPTTTTKREGGDINGGNDWNPCLILFNYYDRTYWIGALAGQGGSTNSGPMTNAFFYQGRIGLRPIADLDIMASLAYAKADEKPTGYAENDYGYEVDVTATYKITNNLFYMLGVGYLFTGDYFKGTDSVSKIDDNYMVINKLTLTF
ncbi:MAG: hypothetical protein A2031_07170 [Deltaproteobacteria bacterium RBG_19FT_COMBO_43_11]|nr:MAG: hypothetical protein A2031_07170 [Deltaproteobacteria bacterium RBG_19FT_COMBO_43_11]